MVRIEVVTCAEREFPFRGQREVAIDADVLVHGPFLLRAGIRECVVDVEAPGDVEFRVGVEIASPERSGVFLFLFFLLVHQLLEPYLL